MRSSYQLNNHDSLMDFKSETFQRIKKHNFSLELSEKKAKDGSIDKNVRLIPMTIAHYIAILAVAMLKSLILILSLFMAYQIYHDIQAHTEIQKTKALIELKNCEAEYQYNQCSENYVIESMFKRCQELEICMNQNVEQKVRAEQLWLKVLGNSFENIFKDLSYKTCIILSLIAATLSFVSIKR